MKPGVRAYTLIELMVVLVAIALIAALLAPALLTTRAKRRQDTCLSQMRQLGVAFGQYVADYDDTYPARRVAPIVGTPPAPDTGSSLDWEGALRQYLKDPAVLHCPSDEAPAAGGSYAVNGWIEYGLKRSDVRTPWLWILLGERNRRERSTGGSAFYWWTWEGTPIHWPPDPKFDPTGAADRDLDLARHLGRSNWLCGDGHVRGESLKSLWGASRATVFWPDSRRK